MDVIAFILGIESFIFVALLFVGLPDKKTVRPVDVLKVAIYAYGMPFSLIYLLLATTKEN